jgi:3',5'-cyclic AMP phosphodiesterase CpdA
MEQIGQFPAARHVLAHVSDPQLGAGDTVYGGVRADDHLAAVMTAVVAHRPEAIVLTGDIADAGDPAAYERARHIVGDAAAGIDAEVVWVMGNHDRRDAFARGLLDTEVDPGAPLDGVVMIGGLRLVVLDTTVPGYHDGRLEPDQLTWLAAQLADPAPDGTIVAMHHPPTPTHLPLAALIELADQHLLADVLRGTDVRAVLAGHYHYSAHTTIAGIPVSIAPSTCYALDAGFDPRGLAGVDGLRGFDLVHVHEDRVVHTTVPLRTSADRPMAAVSYPVEALDLVRGIAVDRRRDLFARRGGLADVPADQLDPGSIVGP